MENFNYNIIEESTFVFFRQSGSFHGGILGYHRIVPRTAASQKQPPLLRWLLHLGLYQIFKMERIPPAAAINTTVELAKTHQLANLAPVVNGILRAALRS